MEVLRTLVFAAESQNLEMLLIGGHAINFYGLSRQTGDLDLIVKLSQKNEFLEILKKLKYTKSQDDNNFTRHKPAELGEWPIDLMYVDDQTFASLYKNSTQGQVGVADIKIVSARHLALLKIHALKHYQAHRFAKDYNDLLFLIRTSKCDFSEEELKELCLKYASLDLYEKLGRDSKNNIEG